MNTWETALVYLLENDVDVAAIVGDRVYDELPQTPSLPAITYKEISTDIDANVDYAKTRVQVTSWAATRSAAKELAKTIRYALQRYRGTVVSVKIEGITFVFSTHVRDPETGYHTMPTDYRINYWEE